MATRCITVPTLSAVSQVSSGRAPPPSSCSGQGMLTPAAAWQVWGANHRVSPGLQGRQEKRFRWCVISKVLQGRMVTGKLHARKSQDEELQQRQQPACDALASL
jgi:hypothetical protein